MEISHIRIFLFDLDGTLIWTGGAGVRALERAFWDVFGIQGGMQGIVCDGKTDPAIVREVLSARGLASHENIQRLLDSYVGHLPETVAASAGYKVLAGVRETLAYLEARGDLLCGLATGNVERGARAKLERAGLHRHFAVGGFGSDSEDRAELVGIAVRRARKALADPQARAAVIGDTPRDVKAALEAGALAVGVASGNFDRKALAQAGAQLVLDDLGRPEDWISQLTDSGTPAPG